MPNFSLPALIALAALLATPVQAQSLAGGYSDAVGFGAMGGVILLLLAWAGSLRRQLRRISPSTSRENCATPPAPRDPKPSAEPSVGDSELLNALLCNSSAFIYFKDRQSRFLRCSKPVYERVGVPLKDFLGKTDFDIFDGVHARPAFEDEQEIMRTGQGFEGKVEHEVLKDGSEYWVLTSKMPLLNKAGEIIGTFGINKDITDLKRTQTQLAYERDLLTTLLDNTPDIIYFKDLQSRFVRVSKSKVETSLALARSVYEKSCREGTADSLPAYLSAPEEFAQYLLGKSEFDIFPEERARLALADEQEIMRTGASLGGKLEKIVYPDGRMSWAVTTKMPWRAHDGRIIGTFGIAKDVTFIKEAEAKLETVHKQLLDASRQAGMAEVATTVLHNVGNVLNSVNISASVVAEKVNNSKWNNFGKAAELLREHQNDLSTYLTTDPKGSKLPAYFATLAESLADEHKEMLEEVCSLRANIEHIKEIVAMQQAYARVAGLLETLEATDLIEDALRLNAGAFERHHVQVIREFTPTPPLLVDKHKVLQILVNLIRNAKYALEDLKAGEKRMRLCCGPGENGTVKIVVIDNGVGIPAENLNRIFEHGFTTRETGHGFALHSGALAARQMGGSLTCHSAGPGHGATFTLELPVRPPEDSE